MPAFIGGKVKWILDGDGFSQPYIPDDPDYKKIVPESKIELFDVRKDISEKHDLSASMPEKAMNMERMLDDWLKETGARTPVKNENFDPERWNFATAHKVDEDGNIIWVK